MNRSTVSSCIDFTQSEVGYYRSKLEGLRDGEARDGDEGIHHSLVMAVKSRIKIYTEITNLLRLIETGNWNALRNIIVKEGYYGPHS